MIWKRSGIINCCRFSRFRNITCCGSTSYAPIVTNLDAIYKYWYNFKFFFPKFYLFFVADRFGGTLIYCVQVLCEDFNS